MARDKPGRIVVGVDGSPSSNEALEWAAAQAERTGAALELVTAWEWPKSYGYPLPVTSDFDPTAVAKQVNAPALDQVRQKHPVVEASSQIVDGNAGKMLTEIAAGADLLVVGRRGHTEVVEMLLGSCSEYCVAHARCPVVVVR